MTLEEATDLMNRYLIAMGPDVAAVYDGPERELMITALLTEQDYPDGQDRVLTRYVHAVISGVGGVN